MSNLIIRTQCDDVNCHLCKYDSWTYRDSYHAKHTGTVTTEISHSACSFGDYDNSCAVERANVRYLKENSNATIECGSYGSETAWLEDTEENRELLKSLDNYPCFDDELASEVEREIEDEYLKDRGDDVKAEFSNDLRDLLYDLDCFEFDYETYRAACEETNTYFQVESGGNGYIDFKRIAPVYEKIYLDKNPAVKRLMEIAPTPSFPLNMYSDADDVLNANCVLSQEEVRQVLIYTSELEKR